MWTHFDAPRKDGGYQVHSEWRVDGRVNVMDGSDGMLLGEEDLIGQYFELCAAISSPQDIRSGWNRHPTCA